MEENKVFEKINRRSFITEATHPAEVARLIEQAAR
jgi:hypothetical protein